MSVARCCLFPDKAALAGTLVAARLQAATTPPFKNSLLDNFNDMDPPSGILHETENFLFHITRQYINY